MESDSSFITLKLISVEQAIDVSDRIRALCQQLAVHALKLVEAFGIPDHLCNNPSIYCRLYFQFVLMFQFVFCVCF
jgi:hypothetical protein